MGKLKKDNKHRMFLKFIKLIKIIILVFKKRGQKNDRKKSCRSHSCNSHHTIILLSNNNFCM